MMRCSDVLAARNTTLRSVAAHIPGFEPWTVVYDGEPMPGEKRDPFEEAFNLLLPQPIREQKLAAEGVPLISERRAELAWRVCYATRTCPFSSLALGIASDLGIGCMKDSREAFGLLVHACACVPSLLPLKSRYSCLVNDHGQLQLRYFGSE